MNTNTFRLIVQSRVCAKLDLLKAGRVGFSHRELNYEVTRVCNGFLIELGLNKRLWSRVYKNRVFIYDIRTRRAVIELGIISTQINDPEDATERLFSGFELVLLGGIFNKRVPRELETLLIRKQPYRRVQHNVATASY